MSFNARAREKREANELLVRQEAEQTWPTLTENQKTAIRFGLFPVEVMKEAEGRGHDEHALGIALMDVAARNGGMRA